MSAYRVCTPLGAGEKGYSMKMSRKKRRAERQKTERRIDGLSRSLGRMFQQAIDSKRCVICGDEASGIGDGLTYCQNHFWDAFEKKNGL